MNRVATLLALALGPSLARADDAFDGTHRIPADVVIEAEREFPEIVFVLHTGRRTEILRPAPGRPYHMRAADWVGPNALAMIYVIPAHEFTGQTDEEILREWTDFRKDGLHTTLTERLEFFTSVWFYDTRKAVVNTYRISDGGLWPRVRLAHRTPESTRAFATRCAVGVFLTAAAVLAGRRLFRRRAPE